MAEAQQHKLFVIEAGTLTAIANNERFLREFPFLRSLKSAPQKSGCGSCGTSNVVRADVFMAAKKVIAGLDSSKKQKLKELLNAKQIRIYYRNSGGKTIEHTF